MMPEIKTLLKACNFDMSSTVDVYKFFVNLKQCIKKFVDVYAMSKKFKKYETLETVVDSMKDFFIDRYILTTQSYSVIKNSLSSNLMELNDLKQLDIINTTPNYSIKKIIKAQHTVDKEMVSDYSKYIGQNLSIAEHFMNQISKLPKVGLPVGTVDKFISKINIPQVQFTKNMVLLKLYSRDIKVKESGKLIKAITYVALMREVNCIEFFKVRVDNSFINDLSIVTKNVFNLLDYKCYRDRVQATQWINSLPILDKNVFYNKQVFIVITPGDSHSIEDYSPDLSIYFTHSKLQKNFDYNINNFEGLGLELVGLTVTENEVRQKKEKDFRKENERRNKNGELMLEDAP